MNAFNPALPISRRSMLQAVSSGFGYLAFASMAAQQTRAAGYTSPLAPKQPHFAAKAKRVILMSMQGAPSHVDTFDYKPALNAADGKTGRNGRDLLGSPWKFSRHGQSGLWISELFPHLARHADELCLLRSMQTDLPNHPQAYVQMHTGNFQFTRPSMGAWVLYGLGTENQDLPGFITINPATRIGGAATYGSAFLPAVYQGTRIGDDGRDVASATIGNLHNPTLPGDVQRQQLDLVQSMNRGLLQRQPENPDLEGVIQSYELAFRMQGKVPEIMDVSRESKSTLEMYGIGERATDNFGRQCLLARRFAQAGVRFIEIGMGGWDQHQQLKSKLTSNCTAVDKPFAALLTDLKQLGMLQDTLVLWGGEFGRTPDTKRSDGRDHNAKGYSMVAVGGGVKGGFSYGETDELGYEAAINRMHIHDLHATILHLLGLDHEKLTYKYAGRDFRLTDVHGKVAKDIIA